MVIVICDGAGEIEDEDGEEGDTLVCDECNGGGEETCEWCAVMEKRTVNIVMVILQLENEFQSHQFKTL